MEETSYKRNYGWSLTIEAEEGLFGLWSCWVGDRFYLCYPKHLQIPDDLIIDTLEVEYSKPVVSIAPYGNIPYHNYGNRQWAEFYGPQLDLGRVWIHHNLEAMYGKTFCYIENNRLKKIQYGHDHSGNIYTHEFSRCNIKSPECPTTESIHIQPYRDKFIELLLLLAQSPKGLNITYELTVLTPRDLENNNFSDIKNLGNQVYAKKEKEEIILEGGNSLVPWMCTRKVHIPCTFDNIKSLLL